MHLFTVTVITVLSHYDNVCLHCLDVVSLNNISAMRSGRKNTSLMTQDQMVKQEEEEGGQEEEEGGQQEVGKQSYHLKTNPLKLADYLA